MRLFTIFSYSWKANREISLGWALSGKRILVIGATGTIGIEISKTLAELGATLTLCGRSLGKLQELERQMPTEGHTYHIMYAENQFHEIDMFFKNLSMAGKFNHMVYAAGIMEMQAVRSISPIHVQKILEANFTSFALHVSAFRSPQVSESNEARSIVGVSSISAVSAEGGLSIYGASKAALESFVRTSSLELAREKIRINSIRLGLVESKMAARIRDITGITNHQRYPLGVGSPNDAANAVAFLLMKEADWITGTQLVVDGGYTSGN